MASSCGRCDPSTPRARQTGATASFPALATTTGERLRPDRAMAPIHEVSRQGSNQLQEETPRQFSISSTAHFYIQATQSTAVLTPQLCYSCQQVWPWPAGRVPFLHARVRPPLLRRRGGQCAHLLAGQ